MARVVAALLLAMLLSACNLVTSRVPLIEVSDPAPEIADGRYQAYAGVWAKEAGRLSRAMRARCLDLGFTGIPEAALHMEPALAESAPETLDAEPRRPEQPQRMMHCPFDPAKRKQFPLARIIHKPDALVVTGEGEDESEPARLRLLRLRPGMFLAQQQPDSPDKSYEYLLLRLAPEAAEVHLLQCRDFPSIRVIDAEGRETCEAPSLEAIRADLSALADRIERRAADPPLMLFVRVDRR